MRIAGETPPDAMGSLVGIFETEEAGFARPREPGAARRGGAIGLARGARRREQVRSRHPEHGAQAVAHLHSHAAWKAGVASDDATEPTESRLAREVRESTRCPEPEEAGEAPPHKRVTVRCTPAVREKWALAREMAERVAGRRLRNGEVLELVAAEAFSAISIDPAFAEMPDEPAASLPSEATSAGEECEAPAARARSRGLPRTLASLAAGLEEADAFELDRRLRRAVRLEQTLDAAMAPLLRRISAPEYEWRGDYQALSSYAREQLGISAGKARALLRLERAGDVCPELRDAYRSGRLSWVKAQCLLPLLLLDLEGEWRPVWVAWAERVTVRRLAEDVERALLLRAAHDSAWHRCKFHPERARDPIPAEERRMCAPEIDTEATQQLAWRVPRDVALLYRAVRETLRSRLRAQRGRDLADGEVFEALLDCALLAWSVSDPGARVCTIITSSSAPAVVRIRRITGSRSAPSTTSAACTSGSCGFGGRRRTASSSSSACARAERRSFATGPATPRSGRARSGRSSARGERPESPLPQLRRCVPAEEQTPPRQRF